MATPLVSVIIPAFNAAPTIARALASVARQSYRPLEIVVVDDGSTDGTRSVVESLSTGAEIVVHDARQGAAAARNTGLRHANGHYVAFLDADDEWLPGKLERQIRLLDERPRCVLVTCDTMVHLTSGEAVRAHPVCPPAAGPGAWKDLLMRNFIPTPTVVARRNDLLALNGFNPRLAIGEDLDMWIRLAFTGEIEVVPEVLVNVYFRPGSLMRTHARGELEYVLPIIQAHVAQLSDRLNAKEKRAILGSRHFEIGYGLYEQGLYVRALPLFWRSALLGSRVLKSLTFFPRSLARTVIAPLCKSVGAPASAPGQGQSAMTSGTR